MSSSQGKSKRKSEWKSMWLWIVFILFFFGLQALLWTNAVRLARRHPTRPVPLSLVEPSCISPLDSCCQSKPTCVQKL